MTREEEVRKIMGLSRTSQASVRFMATLATILQAKEDKDDPSIVQDVARSAVNLHLFAVVQVTLMFLYEQISSDALNMKSLQVLLALMIQDAGKRESSELNKITNLMSLLTAFKDIDLDEERKETEELVAKIRMGGSTDAQA